MNAFSQRATSAYATVGTETGVATADAHMLVLMLFEGALFALSDAKRHMAQRQIAAKGEALSKAIAIIENGLKASLDIKAGGVLGDQLAALYDYMGHRLLIANLHNRIEIIDEVSNLLGELRGAWAQIKSPAQTAATTAANGPTYCKA